MEFHKTTFMAIALAALLSSLAPPRAGAVEFLVENAIADTPTGQNFDADIGSAHARRVLAEASWLVWQTLGQTTAGDRKPFSSLTLRVEGGIKRHGSLTEGSVIHLGGGLGPHIYTGEERFDKDQVTRVLYHEVANVWQYNGEGHANPGLLAGIADFIEMKAGHMPAAWARPGEGDRWDERTRGVTARFLEYCEGAHPGFMAKLGKKMKKRYTDRFFAEITGKNVERLWKEYKAKYHA